MPKGKTKVLFKDGIDQLAVCRLASALHTAWPDFPEDSFISACTRGLTKLELKDRVRHLMGAMTRFLPSEYSKALKIVSKAGTNWPPSDPDNPFDGFAAWPLIDWVGTEGIDHPAPSLQALRKLTSLFSAEFAIRPFLLGHTHSTLKELHTWIDDEDHHVRRLISEGSRPRLPWGMQLPMFMTDPTPVLALLEKLKDDESEYVRRSVANNLNDIAKDHPDLAAEVGARWMDGASENRQRLVKHGLRTLIKKGHPGALKALGYAVNPKVKVTLKINSTQLVMGDYLEMEAEIRSTAKQTQKLVIDFAVHFMKANGSLSAKVFKWKVVDLEPGQTVQLRKKQQFVTRSVRKLYPGKHEVEILVGGKGYKKSAFDLKRHS